MLNLKNYQAKAVEKLTAQTFEELARTARRKTILLKAPTGAGKTVVIGNYLAKVFERLPLEATISNKQLAVIWLAPNLLHVQSYESLSGFYSDMRELNVIQLDGLANNRLEPGDLLFLNWSSIDKEKNTFRKKGESGQDLEALILNTRTEGTEILLVIDEAHHTYSTGKRANEVLKIINAKIEVAVTATPPSNIQFNAIIEMPREDVISEEMIKKGIRLNPDFTSEPPGENLRAHLLSLSLNRLKQLRKAHEDEGSGIPPLLLIQLPNDKEIGLEEEEEYIKDQVIRRLEIDHGITIENGKLAIWLSTQKLNLEGIEKYGATVQVLLFKQAVAIGWDCPRASILLIFRKQESYEFSVQTVGRILRMPQQKHYFNNDLNYGYVYTDLSKDMIQLVAEDQGYFETHTAKRIDDYVEVALNSTYMNTRLVRNRLNASYARILHQTAEERLHIVFHQISSPEDFENNKKEASANAIGLSWAVSQIDIPIPVDLEINAYEESITLVDGAHTERFAKSSGELAALFKRFCADNCGSYAKAESWPVMEVAMTSLFEEYFQVYEYDMHKLVLHTRNKPIWEEVIALSLVAFAKHQAEAAANKTREKIQLQWDVPEILTVGEGYNILNAGGYAMDPFLQAQDSSAPEKKFAAYLETHAAHFSWWYKNGDKGREHFAVPYVNARGEDLLFYVDFVIRFKSGLLGLFDTKTEGSDPEAPAKHNALLDYMDSEQKKGRKLVGGVLIATDNFSNWQYCQNRIQDTHNKTGWAFLNIAQLNASTL
jgi:type III restriction enzyme